MGPIVLCQRDHRLYSVLPSQAGQSAHVNELHVTPRPARVCGRQTVAADWAVARCLRPVDMASLAALLRCLRLTASFLGWAAALAH